MADTHGAQGRFLTAFASRGAGPARRHRKDLVVGIYARLVGGLDHELAWDEVWAA